MLILLYGDDTFRSRQRLRQLRDAFRQKFDPTGINTATLDGEILTAEQFNERFAAQGFLAEKRLVAVTNLLTAGKAATQELVLRVLEEEGRTTENILIFWESGEAPEVAAAETRTKAGTKTARRLWNFLFTAAKREHFPALEPLAVQEWIFRQVEQRGGTMEKKAAVRLAAIVDADLWLADAEIEKLLHYKKDQLITEADIDQVTTTRFDDNMFRLTDALGQRDIQTAVRLLEDQFQNGVDPLYLLRILSWHVRNLIGVAALLEAGEQQRAIARILKLHPFVVQKAARQTASFFPDELTAVHDRLLEIDIMIKTRHVDPRIAFDLLATAFRKRSAVTRS